MTQRNVHLVGSLPGSFSRDAMRMALDRVGPYLVSLPDGETGDRSSWIRICLERLRFVPGIETDNPAARFTSFEDVPVHRVRAGAELTCDQMESCIPLAAAAAESYPVFSELRAMYQLPALAFQAGIPSPADLAVLAFGEAGMSPAIYQPCLRAAAAQIGRCAAVLPSDVIYQIEAPVPTSFPVTAPAEHQPKAAAEAAALITQLAAQCPPGTRLGVHLCVGDFNHQAFARPDSARPVALLATEIARSWPPGRTLEYIHLPFALAADPPPADPGFYTPLTQLDVPPHVRLIAGFVHEAIGLDEHRRLLDVIEKALGRTADIATSCGLGRRPDPRHAEDALAKCAALAAT